MSTSPTRATAAARRAVPATILAALLTAAAAIVGCGSSAPKPAHGPNIVFVLTDDMRLSDLAYMPKTSKLLGAEGANFSNFFVSQSICCPSRATLLTGQYAHNHGVRRDTLPAGGYSVLDKKNTLPVWLQSAGYYTIHIGRYLNGYGSEAPADIPPGWSDWHTAIEPSKGSYYGYTLNENGKYHHYGKENVENPRYYQTDVYSNKAVDAIKRRAGKGSFFLDVDYLAPHSDQNAATGPRPSPRDEGTMASVPLPRPPNFNERDISDKPGFLQYAERRRLHPHTIDRITRDFHKRIETLQAVDRGVGRMVKALKQTGQLDNTYFFFSSDNGFFEGEHRIVRGKFLVYDASSHQPLLLRGPGIAPGSRPGEPVANTDLAPTILQIAHATPTKPQDGRSLLPFAEDPSKHSTRAILHEGGIPEHPAALKLHPIPTPREGPAPKTGPGSSNPSPSFWGIRTARYLYVEYKNGDVELYDLAHDPYELRSEIANPAYAKVMQWLHQKLFQLSNCSGSDCSRELGSPPNPG